MNVAPLVSGLRRHANMQNTWSQLGPWQACSVDSFPQQRYLRGLKCLKQRFSAASVAGCGFAGSVRVFLIYPRKFHCVFRGGHPGASWLVSGSVCRYAKLTATSAHSLRQRRMGSVLFGS